MIFIRGLLGRRRGSVSRAAADAPGALACVEFVELVTEYLDGVVDADELRRIEAHLDQCDGCTTYLDQFRETIRAAGHVPPDAVPPEVVHRLLTVYREFREA